jgi:hypothetical protein
LDADAIQNPIISRPAPWKLTPLTVNRQGLEQRPIEFFEELPAGNAEPADRALLVEPLEQLADRRVQLGKAVEPAIA